MDLKRNLQVIIFQANFNSKTKKIIFELFLTTVEEKIEPRIVTNIASAEKNTNHKITRVLYFLVLFRKKLLTSSMKQKKHN